MITADSKDLYSEFLRSDFWINLSKKVRVERAKCQRCGTTENLQCHHVRYTTNLFDVSPEDLEVVCRSCHKKAHGIGQPTQTTTPHVPTTFEEVKRLRGRGKLTRREFVKYKHLLQKKSPRPPPRKWNRYKPVRQIGVWWPGKYEGKAPGEVKEQWVEILRKNREERMERKRRNWEEAMKKEARKRRRRIR